MSSTVTNLQVFRDLDAGGPAHYHLDGGDTAWDPVSRTPIKGPACVLYSYDDRLGEVYVEVNRP